MPRSSKWFLPVRFFKMKFYISHLSHAIYTSCLSVLPLVDSDNICWWIQTMKLLIMYYFLAFCYFLSFMLKLSFQTFILSTISLHYFLTVRDHSSHHTKQLVKGKNFIWKHNTLVIITRPKHKNKIKKVSLLYFLAAIVKWMILQLIHSFWCLLLIKSK